MFKKILQSVVVISMTAFLFAGSYTSELSASEPVADVVVEGTIEEDAETEKNDVDMSTDSLVQEESVVEEEPIEEEIETEVEVEDIPVIEEEPVVEETPVVEEIVEPTIEEEIPVVEETVSYTDEEVELLALVMLAEAEGECEEGRRLVIDVVLNRVDSERHPNTIYDVIYAKGQFTAMWCGRVNEVTVTEEDRQLVREELESRLNYDVLYFRTKHYHKFGTPLFQVGNHYFSTY